MNASVFQVEGVVVRDAFQGPSFSYVTIREGEKQYWDVACFEDGPLNEFRQLRSGAVAKIRGHLGKRKVKGVMGPSGRPMYELQLIADRIKELAPVVPDQRGYQGTPQQAQPTFREPWGGTMAAGLGQRPTPANYPNPAWPNPATTDMPTHQPQPAGDHPGSFDGDDPIPF